MKEGHSKSLDPTKTIAVQSNVMKNEKDFTATKFDKEGTCDPLMVQSYDVSAYTMSVLLIHNILIEHSNILLKPSGYTNGFIIQ